EKPARQSWGPSEEPGAALRRRRLKVTSDAPESLPRRLLPAAARRSRDEPGRTLAVRLRPETWSRVEPPEEVCKPDSVLPPRKRGQQPFIWSPGCPGDRATDPRERAGNPRRTLRSDLPLHGLAPGGVYRASVLTNGPGELLPRRFTLAPGRSPGRSLLCGTFPRSLGAVVSGHPALRSPDFPPVASCDERLLDLL